MRRQSFHCTLRYCNLNYAGLQKILKKHDKLLPQAPCIHFYKAHIASQPWVKGDHQDVQVSYILGHGR